MDWWTQILRAKESGDAGGGEPEGGDSGDGDAGGGAGSSATAVFKWDGALPEDRPEVWKSYKTFQDAAKAHHELRTKLTADQARFSELQTEHKQTKDALATYSKKQEQQQAHAKVAENTKLWQQSVDAYVSNEGQADHEYIEKLALATGLSEQMILDVHQKHFEDRNRFIEKVKVAHPDFDVDAVRQWVESGESPFDDGMIRAFYWMAEHDEIGWVKHVKEAYAAHLQNGGRVPQRKGTARRPGGSQPLQGRPAHVEPDVFKTRQEYHTALVEANATGDRSKVDAVYDKLKRSQTANW